MFPVALTGQYRVGEVCTFLAEVNRNPQIPASCF